MNAVATTTKAATHWLVKDNSTLSVSFETAVGSEQVCVCFYINGKAEHTQLHSLPDSRKLWVSMRKDGYEPGNAPEPVAVAPTTIKVNCEAIKATLDHAAAHGVKSPKMVVRDLGFTRAKDVSQNPGHIYVKAGTSYGDEYYGKINPEGYFMPARDCPDHIVERLKEIEGNILEEVRAYGRETGNCSFCTRTLTHKNSIQLLYGPRCAENYGLPHTYGDLEKLGLE